jgi:hypothetical protein
MRLKSTMAGHRGVRDWTEFILSAYCGPICLGAYRKVNFTKALPDLLRALCIRAGTSLRFLPRGLGATSTDPPLRP